MDKKLFKSLMWLITAAVVIVVCCLRFDSITSALSLVLSLLSPLIVGLIIAFILNPAYEFFRSLYSGEKKLKFFKKKVPRKVSAKVVVDVIFKGMCICFAIRFKYFM